MAKRKMTKKKKLMKMRLRMKKMKMRMRTQSLDFLPKNIKLRISRNLGRLDSIYTRRKKRSNFLSRTSTSRENVSKTRKRISSQTLKRQRKRSKTSNPKRCPNSTNYRYLWCLRLSKSKT
jgi:hypothetical protein